MEGPFSNVSRKSWDETSALGSPSSLGKMVASKWNPPGLERFALTLLLLCISQGADGELALTTEEMPYEAENDTGILNAGQQSLHS